MSEVELAARDVEVQSQTAASLKNDVPSVSSKTHLGHPKPPRVHHAMLVSIGRRLFVILPLCICLINTITRIYASSGKLSSKTPSDSFMAPYGYGQAVQLYTCDLDSTFSLCSSTTAVNPSNAVQLFCETSTVSYVTIQCSYSSKTEFIAFLAIWCAVFGLYIIYYLFATSFYSTWDLRFYINEHGVRTGIVSLVFKVVALSFTAITAAYGIYATLGQDQSYASDSQDGELIVQSLLFLVFNAAGILRFMQVHPSLINTKKVPMTDFPEEIPINYVKAPALQNLYGVVTNMGDTFTVLEHEIARSLLRGDDEIINRIGDKELIVAALKKMDLV